MSNPVNEIDWDKLGAADVAVSLTNLHSEARDERLIAYNQLMERLTPFFPMEGYTSDEELLSQMRSGIHLKIIPVFIDLLAHTEPVDHRIFLLEILHDLAKYRETAKYVREPEKAVYLNWANQLVDAIAQGMDTYQRLLDDKSSGLQQDVEDLLRVLK
jgi:hypothetical protein